MAHTTPFVDAMKHSVIRLHTSSQLRGVAPREEASLTGYTSWIRGQQQVIKACARFPVQPKVDLLEALETEMFYLELELHARYDDYLDILHQPLPIVDGYVSYIDSLPEHVLGCHWYSAVFAHLVGGNRIIASTASRDLPSSWIETSDFFRPVDACDVLCLRGAFEDHAQKHWTTKQRVECLSDMTESFRGVMHLQDLLFRSPGEGTT